VFALLALVVVLYLRSRSASAAAAASLPVTASQTDGSAAQQPAGGAGNSADNLAPILNNGVTVDPLTGQVQQTDTSSVQAPQMLQTQTYTPPPPGIQIDPRTGTTTNIAGYPTNTSYRDLGITPSPISVSAPAGMISSYPASVASESSPYSWGTGGKQ